jgi:hypothetical protein
MEILSYVVRTGVFTSISGFIGLLFMVSVFPGAYKSPLLYIKIFTRLVSDEGPGLLLQPHNSYPIFF